MNEKPEGYVFGRPTLYRPEYCEMLIDHMSTGLSFESFAGKIRTSKETIYEWARIHQNFSEAKKIAFEQNRVFWEEKGIEGLWHGGKDQPNFNSSVWIFNMKNRFKWTDRVETTVEQNSPFKLSYDPYEDKSKKEKSDE